MKIGILGGTFNPVHYGHLRSAEEVQERLGFERIIFIPSGKPSFKKSGLIEAHHRYEMTKTAIQGNHTFVLSDTEVKNKKTSYSVETISKLTEKHKHAEFFLILGIDAFLDLPKWKQPLRLMNLTNLVIISRPGFSFTEIISLPYLKNAHKKVLRDLDSGEKTMASLELATGEKAILCNVAWLDISASRIRNLIRAGKSIKYLLPDSVESYIISHKLYKKI